ncbi:hypothetical protein Nmel_006046 [Mimus melanotis]
MPAETALARCRWRLGIAPCLPSFLPPHREAAGAAIAVEAVGAQPQPRLRGRSGAALGCRAVRPPAPRVPRSPAPGVTCDSSLCPRGDSSLCPRGDSSPSRRLEAAVPPAVSVRGPRVEPVITGML